MSSSYMNSQQQNQQHHHHHQQQQQQQQQYQQQNGKTMSFRDESMARAKSLSSNEMNIHHHNHYNYQNNASNGNYNGLDENPFGTSSPERNNNQFAVSSRISNNNNNYINDVNYHQSNNFYRENHYISPVQNQNHLNYSNNQNIHNYSSNNYINNANLVIEAELIRDGDNLPIMAQPTQGNGPILVGDRKKEAQKLWRNKGAGASQMMEERRSELFRESAHSSHSFSVKVIDAQTRLDINDQNYTAYIIEVSSQQTLLPSQPQQASVHNDTNGTNCLVEHRYSDFYKLHTALEVNGIKFKNSKFPRKNLAGRIGNWTPSLTWAPEKHADLIQRRLYKLDAWLVELCELLQQNQIPQPELQRQITEFLVPASSNHHHQQQEGSPQVTLPCDRENNIAWKPLAPTQSSLLPTQQSSTLLLSNHPHNTNNNNVGGPPMKYKKGAGKYIPNPIRFTLGSSIRQATYAVMSMCGSNRDSGINKYMPTSDVTIPLDLLQKARGLAFLTVAKGGFLISTRFGTGLIIAKRDYPRIVSDSSNDPSDNNRISWSPPCAIGTFGMGWGALIGGDITTYLIVLNTDKAVEAFAQPSGTINLGAEMDVAVGPIGRGATGNLNAGTKAQKIVPAYAYAHSKGFFAGISLEGSMIATRPEVNAKFYGKHISAHDILFGSAVDPPRSAQCLYKALDEAMSVPTLGLGGILPSQLLLNNNQPNAAMLTNNKSYGNAYNNNFNSNTLTPS